MLNSFLNKYKFAFTYPCPRKLREIVKMSLFERESKDQVISLWMEYHKEKQHNVAYIVSKDEYEILKRNTKESPLFLLPIKRKGGHFQLIGQSQTNSILFTFLEEYKKSGSFSTPYFILTIFEELLASKQLALIRGDIMDYKIDKDEATFLTNQFLKFYMTPELYEKYIYTLNHKQHEFNYDDFKNHFQI
ncbi:unnamed protein product [Paramecium pentaurelia]|uniref:ATP synthase mitochondrial F1 complex assembly factor 1 n=1 Tax=Paramecium pentaurelia TaxID=43138 RepID=A0A8S1USQ3_9CILI|nr:unnamed protein product [Paramecium pentaurelia]